MRGGGGAAARAACGALKRAILPVDVGKQPLETFDPRDPRWGRRLWVFLTMPGGVLRLHVFWRRVAALAGILLLAAWLAGAGAVRVQALRRGLEGVRYLDIVLPWRWDDYRASIGRHHWNQGRRAHEEGRARAVFSPLVAALRHTPENVEARRLLGIHYLRVGHLRFAANCLEDGLPWTSGDLDQIKMLFAALEEMHEDARALRIAARLLPSRPTERLTDLYVALQAATALFQLGRYDQAEAVVARWGLGRSLEGQLLLARCDHERGDTDAALARLDEQAGRFPGRDELALERLRLLREAGRDGAWRREALLRTFAFPDGPGPRADWIASLRQTAQPGVEAEIERFLADFSRDGRALALLGWEAVDAADLALATRVRRAAEAAGAALNAFVLIEVQAALAADKGPVALALAEDGLRHNTEHNPHYAPVLAGLRALAHYVSGDPVRGDLELAAFVNHDGLRAADGVMMARELGRLGAHTAARRVLDSATTFDPRNQAALTRLVLLLAEQRRWDEAERAAARLLAMRKPSRAVLEEVALRLAAEPVDTAPRLASMLEARLLRRE